MRFVSHLDMQRLIQRALRRADIPMSYSNGFNPHPQLSFATALSVGHTSSAEWLDIRLERDMDAEDFAIRMNAALPEGYSVKEAFAAEDKLPALSAMMCGGDYTVKLIWPGMDAASLQPYLDKLTGSPIVVEKRTKGGLKMVDILPQVTSVMCEDGSGCIILHISGQLDASGSLSVELLLKSLFLCANSEPSDIRVHRDTVHFNEKMQPLAAF